MAATGAAPGNSAVRRGQALSLEEGFGKRAPKRCGSKEGGRDAVPGGPGLAPAGGKRMCRLRALLVRRRRLLLPRSNESGRVYRVQTRRAPKAAEDQPAPNLGGMTPLCPRPALRHHFFTVFKDAHSVGPRVEAAGPPFRPLSSTRSRSRGCRGASNVGARAARTRLVGRVGSLSARPALPAASGRGGGEEAAGRRDQEALRVGP